MGSANIIASVEVEPIGVKMMNFHHEVGKAEIDGHLIRFCQHINGGCFWLAVDEELYQVTTESFMNAVLNAVMEYRKNVKDQHTSEPIRE